jgi:hypothetical protein
MRYRAVYIALPAIHQAVIGLAEAHGLFQNHVEHRREVAGRGIDDLQHLSGRGLLFERLVALSSALSEFAPEIGNNLLQTG